MTILSVDTVIPIMQIEKLLSLTAVQPVSGLARICIRIYLVSIPLDLMPHELTEN